MDKQKKNTKQYWPLVALILVAILGSTALTYGMQKGPFVWMHFFMGFFLCQFAMLKLFHPSAFADGFRMYDLIAKKFSFYAYIYPFIELTMGLAYLWLIYPITTYVITILIMGISMIGVIRALRKKLDIKCACMGTILDVPLSTVTLSEDIVMIAMAYYMLIATLIT